MGYETRLESEATWNAWLARVAGYHTADVEVVHRTLRIKDQGAPHVAPEAAPAVAATVAASAPPPVVTTAQVPAAAPPPPPGVAPAAASDPVKERVLELVVEKTGYPQDMLDLDLDLEADLGVDTVKQAELFAAIRGEYGIPRDENLKLRDFPTIAHAIQFVYDRRPDLAANKAAAKVAAAAATLPGVPAAAVVAPSAQDVDAVRDRVLELVVEKTGYPKDMLDLDLDLEADLGVDTVKQAELFAAIRGEYGIPRDENLKLRDFPTIAHAIQFVYDRRPDLAASKATTAAASVPSPVASAPSPVVPATQAVDEVRERVLDLVVDKTGYPRDMLDLDLDLEADLGVDTVKQAELFAAIRGAYDIPRDDNLKLRDFPTITHAIQFVYDRRPDLKASPAPPAPAPAATPVEAAPAAGDDAVRSRVLALVAEKTGYPEDMLALDLDLEADLGIDTVKQAEIFAAARTAYGIPRDENLKLRDFPTLGHVIQFVKDRIPDTHADTTSQVVHTDETTSPSESEETSQIPRRIPTSELRPPLDLCVETGVAVAPGTRILVMPDEGGVATTLVEKITSLGAEALVVTGRPEAAELETRIASWLADGPIHGVYWLSPLDDEGSIALMDLAQWREALRVRVKLFASTMRALYEQIASRESFLVSGTRLGGRHGYSAEGATAPLGGAATGFTKSYKRERPDATVKAVDFAIDRDADEIATLLIGETLRDPGAVEIGYADGLRWTVGLAESALDPSDAMILGKDSVFVVSGAAGSIVSAITADRAVHSGGTFYLLDLVPKPDADDPDIRKFETDRDGLRHDIFERRKATGERVTPAMVERDIARLEREHAALSAIRAVAAAGGVAHYASVKLLAAN
ncbi:MAG TPA: phosphopantetheine-binding protein, partial [Blastocatellia bacterium]|nr:phosphopantetheine-binding protein [Blastocatellia bacterium]